MAVFRHAPGSPPGAFCFAGRHTTTARTARVSLIALGLAIVFALSGCGRPAPAADLAIVNGPEPESLDPHLATGQADGRIALSLFEGLTRYDPVTAGSIPGIAERWDISPDGRTYQFYLRTNAAWSTGEPIVADDFVYSWRRILDPATASEYAGVLFYVKNGEPFATGKLKDFSQVGVHARNPHQLEVELESPTPFFLDLAAYQPFAVVPRKMIERYGDRWLHARPFMASGAYTLDFWRLNDHVRLRRNPHYWDAAHTRSDVVDLLTCGSPATALNLFVTHAVDVVWDKELVPTDLVDLLRQRPDFHTYPSLGTYFIRCNVTRKPFDDPRVRQAFAMATDKRRIVERLTRGGERIAGSLTPPGITNAGGVYQPPAGLPFDPDRARALLAAAGYPEGRGFPPVIYTYNTADMHRKIGVELRDMWRHELGVTVELKQLEWKSYFRAQSMLDYDLIRSSWIGDYNDPNTFLDLFLSDNPNNRTGWKSAAYDAGLRAANAELDPAARLHRLREVERLLVETEAPIIPLFFYVGMEFYDTARVAGLYSNLRSEHPLRTIYRRDRTRP